MIFWYTVKPWEHTGIKGNPETMANFYLKLLYYNNSTISVFGFPWPGWKQSANWKNWVNVFITRWNTEKRVEKVMHSGEFLMNFKMFYLVIKQMYQAFDTVFHLVMKHCVECLILLLKQNDFTRRNWGCKNEQFFIWFLNTHLTLISLVFSLWIIINELEKLNS